MKTLILLALVFSFTLRAEQDMSEQDKQFLQMMAQKREAEEREKQFSEPLKPVIGKDRAVSGSRTAPIMIVAFSDFQCPYCSRGAATLEEVRKKYGKKIAFMFKHLPLPFHQMARPAAEIFEAIAMQSPIKAYKYHDEVFHNQNRLGSEGEAFLDEVTKKVGANLDKVKKDRANPKVQSHIADDQKEAQEFGISGTPGFIIAGVALKGAYPASEFETIIDRRLKEAKK